MFWPSYIYLFYFEIQFQRNSEMYVDIVSGVHNLYWIKYDLQSMKRVHLCNLQVYSMLWEVTDVAYVYLFTLNNFQLD